MADTSVSGARVARELHALVRIYGKPQQNAFIETFNSRLRAEVLNEEGLDSLEDAQRKLARWRYDDTKSGHIHLWHTKHPRKRAERLINLKAPRTQRLPEPTTKRL